MTETKQPKLLSYCSILYARFLSESITESVEGLEVRVWRGKLTKTATAVGIPDGVYKRVVDQLITLKCIDQLQQGRRGSNPTTIILLRPPTADVWDDEIRARDLTRSLTPAILSRRLDDLERQLKGVDIVKALGELQKQIDELNKSVKKLQDLHYKQLPKTNKESNVT